MNVSVIAKIFTYIASMTATSLIVIVKYVATYLTTHVCNCLPLNNKDVSGVFFDLPTQWDITTVIVLRM